MPAQPAAAGGQPAAQGGQQNNGQSIMRTVLQSAAIFMGIQFVMQRLLPAKTTTTATDAEGNTIKVPANTGNIPPFLLRPANLDEGATWNPIPQRIAPIWPADSKLDIVISVSPSFIPTSLRKTNPTNIVLQEKAFGLNNYSDTRSVDTTINIPVDVQNNGTLWGHFYIGLTGHPIDPVDHGFDPANAYHFVFPLTQHIAKKKEAKVRNLLEAQDVEEEVVEEDTTTGPIIGNYYHPNTSLSFIPGSGVLDYPQTHPAVRQFLQLEATGARDGSGQNAWYYPILFINTFWQLKSHMTLLNDTVKTVPLHIDLGNLADWKFKTMAAIELSGREAARTAAFGGSLPGGGDGSEIQMIKEILLDTNPILLTITTLVAIAHMILETLAFGSDIAHYRKKKDNVGISVRSILANVFMQSVIFLYLIDNSQTTSWMILGSQGIGILIEFWKITTVVNVRVRDSAPGSFFPKRIVFEDKHKLSETEEKTKEYDEIAFKYMYWAGVPLLIAYAAYSLYYDSHKSWYSFIITTLVGSVYAYGFLMMVPSLYINYRLKSVAHMPGKAMMYKFLNTFIDDLFAFTIKMPFLHRLACFRDDIIFFIYLYQRWAYRIDYTRVNEFGQGGDDETEEQKSAEGKALPPAVPVEPEEEKKTKKDEELQAEAKATGASKGAAKKRK